MADETPAAPFAQARHAALEGSAALAAAVGAAPQLFTEVQANATPPYVVEGEDQILLEKDACADEAEVYATVHIWSLTEPLDRGAQARAMGGAVVGAMLALSVTGWDVDLAELQSERYFTDPDQSTHGVLTFHYLLTKQAA